MYCELPSQSGGELDRWLTNASAFLRRRACDSRRTTQLLSLRLRPVKSAFVWFYVSEPKGAVPSTASPGAGVKRHGLEDRPDDLLRLAPRQCANLQDER
jgi:hypothetical protein